jgi:NAD(P)-dependent dehydrogenase (short-subunit alcohol dehydrogenase family)
MSAKSDAPGVALLTGAASGMGRATSVALAHAGVSGLALLDLNLSGLEETKSLVHKINSAIKIELYTCDVTVESSVISAYTSAKDAFSRIDYAIHCAGVITFQGPSADCALESFDRQTNVNYRGLWLCSREALRVMRTQKLDVEAYPEAGIPPHRAQRGSIVNIASSLALYSISGIPAYCGAKGGVTAITRSDAIDYAAQKIRVNAVLPGVVDSPMTTSDPKTKQMMIDTAVNRSTPLRRFGLPEEIADVCVFLAGNKASFVTGASWTVDGGSSAGHFYD